MISPAATVATRVQLASVLGDLGGNVSRAADAIDAAARAGADVVVLPELSTSGYVFDPDGWVVAATSEASGTASAALDRMASRDEALTERADAMADRRPGLYAAVVGRGSRDRGER